MEESTELETPEDHSISDLVYRWRPIRDELETETSELQDDTIEECLSYLARCLPSDPSGAFTHTTLPGLARDKHIRYLHHSLETLPSAYVAYDASRPWLIYWVLTALSLLGEDVSQYRKRVSETLSSMQNASGGFAGGHGQISHCAPSYAAVLSLAMVGGSENGTGSVRSNSRTVDSESVLMEKKMFGMAPLYLGNSGANHGRGGYCSMVMITLLKLPSVLPPDAPARQAGLESFMDGLPEYMSRCKHPLA
ncbi:MAG: hypothetical protein Q9220_004730 [cf. Caloplaca sp. 1 TL-2023]